MADILPEPTEDRPEMPVLATSEPPRALKPGVKRTLYVLAGLIILAGLCLLAGYIYDVVHNNHQDNTRKADLSYISNVLDQYYDLYHYYPTLEQVNSSTFSAFAPSLNRDKFKDPSTNSSILSSAPSTGNYAYELSPDNCNNTTSPCTAYKLVAILSSGSDYTVTSPQHKS